jgi:hypothetical protein
MPTSTPCSTSARFVGPPPGGCATSSQALRRHVLRHHRRRVHVHHRHGAEALAPAAASRASAFAPSYTADEQAAHPRAADGRRDLERYLHTRYVGQKRFSLEGRRQPDPDARQPAAARGRAGRPGTRDRHGPPRPPQRAGQHAGQDARRPVLGVRGQARRRTAGGRRQVPPGLLVRRHDARRADAPDARVQSVAPGDRESRGRGLGARPPASPRRQAKAGRCCRC